MPAEDRLVKVSSKPNETPKIEAPYKRPSGATTPEQRKAVQGQPCVDCGKADGKKNADHKKPLVEEYYETGQVDRKKMKSTNAVQPQCPTCSAKQGGRLSGYSKGKKKELVDGKTQSP